MVDINNFKEINDQYGHFAGDLMLKDVAEEIKHCFLTPEDWASRWGGNGFLLVLFDQEQVARQQIKTMHQNINTKLIPFENKQISYRIRFGKTQYEADKSLQGNLKQAD